MLSLIIIYTYDSGLQPIGSLRSKKYNDVDWNLNISCYLIKWKVTIDLCLFHRVKGKFTRETMIKCIVNDFKILIGQPFTSDYDMFFNNCQANLAIYSCLIFFKFRWFSNSGMITFTNYKYFARLFIVATFLF